MARVLVVDDQDTYRRYLKLELEDAGHEVETAGSGRDAIERGKAFRPDVLVVDWLLKDDFTGLEVTDAIREACPAVKTLMITGYPSAELKQRASRSRIARFIKKPFTLADILANVQAVLHE